MTNLLCEACEHPRHEEDDCEYITGYDHLNGDHYCGCPGDIPTVNGQELAEMLGMTYRRVDYWIRVGYLMVEDTGSGYKREIPPREVEVAKLMNRLVLAGLTPGAAAVASRRMVMGQTTSSTLPHDVLVLILPERDSESHGA